MFELMTSEVSARKLLGQAPAHLRAMAETNATERTFEQMISNLSD